jgi:hypothetical protein
MPFFLDGNPTPGELSEAVNYLLSNFIQNTSADPATGQIVSPTGRVQGYLYRYLAVKYADSFDGTLNFSNTPTNRFYYGLRNTDTATPESSNPADYIWYQVTGGFSTTKLLYYTVTGGRQINVLAALAAPSALWQSDTGTAIDLDIISGSDGASSRICYAKSTSFALASTPSTYQTTGPSGFPPTNTWGGSETWQATPPTLNPNEALFQSDGIYNPTTNLTTWNVPYLSNLRVGALSAISADLGTITAGDLSVGTTPAISGTSMTGTGAHIYSNGQMVVGNSTNNMVFDGTSLTINGNIVTYGNLNGTAVGQIIAGSFNFVPFTTTGTSTFTVPANVYKLKITAIGGGGSGSGTTTLNATASGGGGGGACINVISVTPGASYTVVVGAGGTTVNSSGTITYTDGGNSSFTGTGVSMVANGGQGAQFDTVNPTRVIIPGFGGTASGGLLNFTGSKGGNSPAYGGSAPLIGSLASFGSSASTNSGGGGGGSNVPAYPNANYYIGRDGGSGLCIIEY